MPKKSVNLTRKKEVSCKTKHLDSWTGVLAQVPTCSILHVFYLHDLGVYPASEQVLWAVDRFGPFRGLLP